MRPIGLLKNTDPVTLSGPQRSWRRERLAAAAIAAAVAAVIAAGPAVAGAATAHHSLADNGVISSHN